MPCGTGDGPIGQVDCPRPTTGGPAGPTGVKKFRWLNPPGAFAGTTYVGIFDHPFTVDELRTLLHLATSRDLVPLYGDDEVGASVVAKLEKLIEAM